MKGPEHPQTNLPYETLLETIELIQNTPHTDHTREEVAPYQRATQYLKHILQLYFKCAGCDRMVAPDEEHYQDPASENWYCMACLDEGI